MKKKLLSIGEAAELLGIQVDTLRRHERQGHIKATRTDGDQRRFELSEVQRFRASRKSGFGRPHPPRQGRHRQVKPATRAPASSSRTAAKRGTLPVYPEDHDPFDQLDEVEGIEWADELEPTARPVARPQPPAYNPPENADRVRLDDIKRSALLTIPFSVPATWRAKVIEDLERYVTAERFPNYLSVIEAWNLAKTRVEEVLKGYHEERAPENAAREAATKIEHRLQSLKSHGTMYCSSETAGWDYTALVEARRDVEQVLERDVKPDWTEGEVQDLVDETLDEWVEEDEDEEPEDDGEAPEDEW
jgi:excisionase family DNA binding protein